MTTSLLSPRRHAMREAAQQLDRARFYRVLGPASARECIRFIIAARRQSRLLESLRHDVIVPDSRSALQSVQVTAKGAPCFS